MIHSCHDVILYRFFQPKSGDMQLHRWLCSCSWLCSCTVGYAVAQLAIQLHSWLCSYTIGYTFAQLAMQLHSWLCSYTVGYAVAQLAMQLHIFYYLGTQLHGDQSIQYCAYGEISATAYLFVQQYIMML